MSTNHEQPKPLPAMITIRVPQAMRQALNHLAWRRRLSVNRLLVGMIERELSSKEPEAQP